MAKTKEEATPELHARYAIEAYRYWKEGDVWHYTVWREKAIKQGELLRIEVVPFRQGTGIEHRQRIAGEKRAERTV